ncbi:hypothetical protein JP09_009830 [Dehalogenimonas etheniformans]|uniref:Uncharacterized protein n=1 Tax=Dehalogenimonas etheniformans TaxID=1536648 RepID=A0A2P5P4W3_9CHLR|nr:hypothetical protein JP09_009830 [Dehalogenimonas etheniformans]
MRAGTSLKTYPFPRRATSSRREGAGVRFLFWFQSFWIWFFELVSYFEIRISDLKKRYALATVKNLIPHFGAGVRFFVVKIFLQKRHETLDSLKERLCYNARV